MAFVWLPTKAFGLLRLSANLRLTFKSTKKPLRMWGGSSRVLWDVAKWKENKRKSKYPGLQPGLKKSIELECSSSLPSFDKKINKDSSLIDQRWTLKSMLQNLIRFWNQGAAVDVAPVMDWISATTCREFFFILAWWCNAWSVPWLS